MNQSILNGFLIFGIIQAFLFVGLLVSKKKRTSADLVMTTWLLLFAIHSFLILVNLNNDTCSILQILPVSLTLLYGPFLLLYVDGVNATVKNKNKRQVLHFIPFVAFFILSFIFFKSPIFLKLLAFSGAISGITYCVFTYKSLNKYKKHITELFSNIEKINLDWVKKLVLGLIAIWMGVLILVTLTRVLSIELPLNWFFLCIPLLICYLGYYGLKQQMIWSFTQKENNVKTTNVPKNEVSQKIESEKSYKKSGLQTRDMASIYKSLERMMQTQKLYLQPTLSLKDLSEESNIPQHHITQTLNEYASENFYDFINAYRIETFKEKLQHGEAENFSLLGIALDCGFNSKSSFNRIFKKSTSLSPSEYNKTIR